MCNAHGLLVLEINLFDFLMVWKAAENVTSFEKECASWNYRGSQIGSLYLGLTHNWLFLFYSIIYRVVRTHFHTLTTDKIAYLRPRWPFSADSRGYSIRPVLWPDTTPTRVSSTSSRQTFRPFSTERRSTRSGNVRRLHGGHHRSARAKGRQTMITDMRRARRLLQTGMQ